MKTPLKISTTWVIDPPWHYDTWSGKGQTRNADAHYATMSKQELLDLRPLWEPFLQHGTALCMWTSPPFKEFAIELGKHWGFSFKTELINWLKLNKHFAKALRKAMNAKLTPVPDEDLPYVLEHLFKPGLGHYTKANSEQLLLFVPKGKRSPVRKVRDINSWLFSPIDDHSHKPDEALRRVQRLFNGPYIELFARRQYPGWRCTGLELDKLDVREAMPLIASELPDAPVYVRPRKAPQPTQLALTMEGLNEYTTGSAGDLAAPGQAAR